MTEPKFWAHLEQRVCREFDGLEEYRRRGLWCDGFVPKEYSLESKTAHVSGHVWIGIGPREHEKWEFTLHMTGPVADREGIPWSDLLPPEEVTGWMKVDAAGRRMAIEPGSAVPTGAGSALPTVP